MNGPGGYFGSSLDSLSDCLSGGFGPAPPFELAWTKSDMARESLAKAFAETSSRQAFLDQVLQLLRNANVTIIFD
jgi:RNAse (barnase) inhibitor barstar